jgi:hypothetical protein
MALPVALDRILEAERRLGVEFPPDLKALILQRNGGHLSANGDDWELHPVWDPTDRRTASRSANHVELETRVARSWSRFPPLAVSIGVNSSGDRLVLLPGSDRIHAWDHETGTCAPIDQEGE